MGLTSGLRWRSRCEFREKIALRVRWRCGFSLAILSPLVWIWRRPTVNTTIDLSFLRHDFTLPCHISLFFHCIFLLFRCGISLLHSRGLFFFIDGGHSYSSPTLPPSFSSDSCFLEPCLNTFLAPHIPFWPLRTKSWKWFFSKIVQLV